MLQGPKGTIWRPANAEEAAEYQLDSAVLKQLADDPGAKVPPASTENARKVTAAT